MGSGSLGGWGKGKEGQVEKPQLLGKDQQKHFQFVSPLWKCLRTALAFAGQ